MASKSPPPPANREARLLFERCAAGDPEAWSRFMAAYHPLLRHLVQAAHRHAGVPSPADAEDIVGDVIEILLRDGGARLRAYDPSYRPSTWLSLVVFTTVRNRLRQEGRLAARERDAAACLAEASGEPTPIETLEGRERLALLREALSSLSVRERLVLRMTYERGLSNLDAGRLLGLSETAVATLLSRARSRLRGLMS